MNKTLGIFLLLVAVCAITAFFEPNFLSSFNVGNLLHRASLFSVISIGALFVIVTGGIDLSIGSVIGFTGVLLPWLLVRQEWSVPAALAMVVVCSLGIGVIHGLLITKVRLQPFVVTLCSLMIFRSLARIVAKETSQGFGNDYTELKSWLIGKWTSSGPTQIVEGFALPMPLIIVLVIATISWIFLNQTIYGRYLLALGRNEQAARFSGIQTDRMVMLAYIICSLLAGIGGILFALDVNSVQPSNHGNFYELYAIAAAVLGGCSLRGGEGSIVGVLIGSALLRVLLNAIVLLQIPSTWEWFVVGSVILIGVIVDEFFKRLAAVRRARREARGAAVEAG